MNIRQVTYDDGLHELHELNRYEDTLDVFINIIIKRSPTIFILINMTLMIWMVQIIFSSNLDQIPTSIQFYAPFLAAYPIIDIKFTKTGYCPWGYNPIQLKVLPKIDDIHLTKSNLTHWEQDLAKFCSKTSNKMYNFNQTCEQSQIYCSGLCVQYEQQCPITSITKVHAEQKMPEGYVQLLQTSDGLYKYIYLKNKNNRFITGLTVTYDSKCANDYPFYQEFKTFQEYWKKSKDCGKEGSLVNKYFHTIDEDTVENFFGYNGIWDQEVDDAVSGEYATLAYMTVISFPQNQRCRNAQSEARDMQKYLVAPTFTESLLVICFIFFTGCWAWLIGFYCFDGKRKQKNMVVILMAIIQLIVIGFIYLQNKKVFFTESMIADINFCIQDEIEAARQWRFGMENDSPFLSIFFTCTCFLLIYILAAIMNKYIYEDFYDSRQHEMRDISHNSRLPSQQQRFSLHSNINNHIDHQYTY